MTNAVSIESETSEDLAKKITEFVNDYKIEKHKFDFTYYIRKQVISSNCYSHNGKHICILVYSENLGLD